MERSMDLATVRNSLTRRLDEADRGDRGWFIVTRVHVSLSWIKRIAEYLESRAGNEPFELTENDYASLGTIINSINADPGIQLRRHHLLVMDKPLQLIQRTDRDWWRRIVLTAQGLELANASDPAQVLECSLMAMHFAIAPWSPPNRVRQYAEFDVPVYRAMIQILDECNGYIDRNEFDFFVSRIRHEGEITWAVEAIRAYRYLDSEDRISLHQEVCLRIPSAKSYQNWRDVALHTFSLFSLGTSMVREGQRLFLTGKWVGEHTVQDPDDTTDPKLRIPDPPEAELLLVPPAAPAGNDGADAESFVAKVLRTKGWEVAFYTNRRGYGFDLWARKGNRAMLVEVKSSLQTLGSVTLTSTEYSAACKHCKNYVIALVEHMDSDSPRLRMIQNPAHNTEITESKSTSYVITRSEWLRAAGE